MSRPAVWACIAVALIGFAFTWWARVYLGDSRSGWVMKKTDHRVIDTGPLCDRAASYLHGPSAGCVCNNGAKGTLSVLLGAVIVVIGIWMKAWLEEQFLRGELGAGAYDSYRRRVPMLVPFGPKST